MQGRGATTAPVAAETRPIAREFVDVLREEFTALHPGADAGRTLADLYAAIHHLEPPQSALCLSGGGIRSASFALGVLQALARHGLLFRFDYLSTVSGGGYIGSWLSAWRRHAEDDSAVLQSLTICGRPPPGKGKRWGRCGAWSDAVICPAFDAAGTQPPACMGVRGLGPDHP